MLSLKEVHAQAKPGDLIHNHGWQDYVTVKVKEITPETLVVEGEHLIESPWTYELVNHPDHWKKWEFRLNG